MKKFTSILTLSLALAMVLGVTAFAYASPNSAVATPANAPYTKSETPISEEAQDNALAVFEKLVTNAESVEVIAAFELTGAPSADKTVTLTYPAADFSKYEYVAMHLQNGEWIKHTVKPGADGTIVIEGVDSLSPFVLVQYVAKATEPQQPQQPQQPQTTASTPTTPVSPKTGETLPVVVVIALIALAGAAVVGTKRVFAAR